MGDCSYCGKSAGWFSRAHPACQTQFDDGVQRIGACMTQFSGTQEEVARNIERASAAARITGAAQRAAIVRGFEKAVTVALEDHLLTEEEEEWLKGVLGELGFTADVQDELNKNGAYTRFVQAVVLRKVMAGTIPDNFKVDGSMPFNFQKNEKLIWLFQDVEYFEQKKKVHYSGGSAGVSVRVASGMYVRLNKFRGEPVASVDNVAMGVGLAAVTNKHLYFAGDQKTFRLRHEKIVAVQVHTDGVTVQRDAISARPQTLLTGDGWFAYNLLLNVAKL